jgi:23S rRNA-/tRNA-specific pseudouridylate synthase
MGWFAKKNDGKRTSKTVEDLTTNVGNYMLAQDNNTTIPTTPNSKNEYVAPAQIVASVGSPSQSSMPPKSPESQILCEVEDEEMVVVDKPIENCMTEDGYGDIENPVSTSFSKGVESEQERHHDQRSSKQSHLNSLFNGHLMKWKFEAEEGSAFLRVPACK